MLATDPGLGHLQAGWRSLVSMVVALAVGYGMAHALDIPSILGMMVGGMMGLMGAFAIAENTPLRLARASLWMPIPFSAALPLGAWLQPHRVLDLCLMVVMLTLAFFLVRFGPLGMLTGMMMFNAFLIGPMAVIPLDDCGRLFIVALVTAAAVLVARLVLCYPMPREDLLRTQRAFVVEARRVADAAATALDPNADQDVAIKRMRRALRQLNVTTLTIDGRLAQPEVAAEPDTAELLHQYLFDAELALQGIGHAVQEMTRRPVPSALREAMVVGLVIARDTPLGRADALRPAAELIRQEAANAPEGTGSDEAELRALARRVGDLLDALADSLACWLQLGWNTPTARAKVPFQPSVALERGLPPGTGPAARRLAAAQGGRGWRRAVPYLRAPLQVGIAAAITLPIADAINGRHFYWGLIGVMITMFGTNTTHERLRKLGHRAVGTVIGAVIGIALVHLIGPGHIYWTLLVIVAGISIGSWGIQRQYAYWVIGLVTALVQLYGLTTQYSKMDWMLTQRLMENVLGIVVATICAALIFPVSTRKVAREAERGYLSALEQLITQVAERWKSPEAPVRLRGAARGVDAALYQMQSVVRPLVRMPLGTRGRGGDNLLALLGTATRHARALASSADIDIDLAPQLRGRVERITEIFTSSLHALDQQVATGERGGTWIRVSPLIRELESVLRAPAGPRADRLRIALCELAALDEVLASLADNRGLTIRTTAAAPSPVAAGVTSPDSPDPRMALTGTPGAPPALRKAAEAASNGGGTGGTSVRTESGTVTVRGAVRCAEHNGCEVWITIVTDRGKRQAMVKAGNGSYAVNGLTPGGYTLIVSSSAHPPHAEFLLVDRPGRDLQHDITLGPAS
ncbi:FUSC family protein [Actinacidiphila oryziradicis]|uniref:FUSC family protein n=1 Tax=Actinacidiphila oryziradicis TaxID=2571141 RepID=UPI0023F26811|nr:FUSC family protein [Actinacidiphila oryziradicis]MCW2873401.1 conserved rane protein of unknown function [Actinacidiphila oryziradicis]